MVKFKVYFRVSGLLGMFIGMFCQVYGQLPAKIVKKQSPEAQNALKKAALLFQTREYKAAARELSLALKTDSLNTLLHQKIAKCYFNSGQKDDALNHLRTVARLDTANKDPEFWNLYARCLHFNLELDSAVTCYQKELQFHKPTDPAYKEAKTMLRHCLNARQIIQAPVKVKVENVGPTINSEYPDFAPVITADGAILYFTSRRPGNIGGLSDDNLPFEDIYEAKFDSVTKTFGQASRLPKPVNTEFHDACVSLGPDGQTLYIYRDHLNGGVFETKLNGTLWLEPAVLPKPISSASNEPSVSITADGNRIYFASDRPGGLGGLDLYFCDKKPDGKWGPAQNLGNQVNTPEDEDGPFIHPDGKTLYFSSKGHYSMGDYDVFRTVVDTAGQWSVPVNLGYPINSPEEDRFFVMDATGKFAYLSSERKGSAGYTDVFRVNFEPDARTDTSIKVVQRKPITQVPSEDIKIDLSMPDFNLGDDFSDASKRKPKKNKSKSFQVTADTDTLPFAARQVTKPIPDTLAVATRNALPANTVTVVKGIVSDANSSKPLSAKLFIVDNEKRDTITTIQTNSQSGKYLITLPSGKNYGVVIQKEGYMFFSENFDLPATASSNTVIKDYALKPIGFTVGAFIQLRNVFYDFGQATIRPASEPELERLLDLLKRYPKMRIRILSHTDDIGSDEFNLKLSDERARSVVTWLTEHGIDNSRLEYKGFGETKPLYPNTSEEGRMMNRRTEFEILNIE